MFKLITLFAVIAYASAQVLRLNPLVLGSTGAAELQTINLQAAPRLARPAVAIRAPIAIRAQPIALAAPRLAIAAAPLARAAILRDEAPEPFTFGFTSVDEFGTQLSRQESGDGSGTVTGSYSLQDPDGRQRIVEYIADEAGFRATVKTNEPGTANANPADVVIQSSAPTRR